MSIHHHLDTSGRCAAMGQSAEDTFAALAKEQGFTVKKSSDHQDRIEHFDFLIEKGGKRYRVEVKSKKGFSILHKGRMIRDFFLLEFVGVTGRAGWLYGQADLVAFQEENGFYLVPRKTLVEVGEKLCTREWVDDKKQMLYKNYGRKDRQDEVSAILVNDILVARNFSFWKKA